VSGDYRHNHLVGILGGMGPAATAEFYTKLVRRTPATRDQDHLRVAIWADPTVPDRVAAAINGSDEPYPAMLHGALRLRDIGVTEIVIPCHTAHIFLPKLVADTGVRFLDMVHETITELAGPRRPVGGVGLLGTRGTIRTGLYQSSLREAGLDVIVPDEAGQEHLDHAIAMVKQANTEAAGRQLQIVLDALAKQDASPIILACTELPLAVPYLPVPRQVELLDPTDLLADAIVRECLGEA
jgi:aspartate racemase